MARSLIDFCERARAQIAAAERILLASHVFPEADSVGSQAALARHLTHLGCEVQICNPTPVHEIYRFLVDLAGLDASVWRDGHESVPDHDLEDIPLPGEARVN